MAKKGIEYAVFGLLQKDGTYKDGKRLGPVAGLTGTATKSDVKDFGDNRIVETDNSVTGGTLSMELNNDSDELYSFLLGHEKSESGEIFYNADDIAPYMGVGAVGMSEGDYVAKFYTKVQFGEPSDENSTKQDTVTYNHVTLEGTILVPEDGIWKRTKRFKTLETAKAYLNEIVGITTGPTVTQVK